MFFHEGASASIFCHLQLHMPSCPWLCCSAYWGVPEGTLYNVRITY